MKDPEQTPTLNAPSPTPVDPNTELYQWLSEKNYELVTDALTEKTPYLAQHGFVLTDKPLLVISCRKKENN